MSKQFDFYSQSGIPNQYGNNLKSRHQMEIAEQTCSDMYKVLFCTMADVVRQKANENPNDRKVACTLNDEKGIFKLGAILTYRAPDSDEEEDSGNWYLEMTFNAEDIEGIENVTSNNDPIFDLFAVQNLSSIVNGTIRDKRWLGILFCTAVDTIKEFLDVNASEEEDISTVMRGVFTASVAVENGIKYMAVIPGETIKQIVKKDSVL